jgi:hypothetical protein
MAAALACGTELTASAQTITGLTTSDTADGPAIERFPENTSLIWVRFDYANASGTAFEVTLSSPSGVPMFARRAEFDGAGSVAWDVSGDAVARGLSARSAEAAVTAADYANRAATQTRGVTEFLATTAFAVSQMETSLGLLARLPLDPTSRGHAQEAAAASAQVRRLLTLASRLPAGDDAGRRDLARQMAAPANDSVTHTAALDAAVGTMAGLPLPPTRSGASERDAHTVAVRINGSPAQTRSLWVFDGTIFLPALARQAPAGGR